MKFLSIFLSLLLTPLVAVMPLQAEMAASIPGNTTPSAQTNGLQIRLAEAGNGEVEANSSLKGYAIVVTDMSGLPVADAAVAIRLPEDGATGFFTDGAHSAVSYTDASGMAKFAQVNWGSTLGTASIRVTAVKGDMHAGALIEQTIVASSAPVSKFQVPAAKLVPLTPVPTAGSAVAAVPTPRQASPVPGTPASVASIRSGAAADQIAETAASAEPTVSIVNTAGAKGGSHGSTKKWIILAAAVVAVGAGVGAAMALGGKGGSAAPTAASTGLSVGTPTISVGH